MSSVFVHTPSSLAWTEICGLVDRASNDVREEWGVDNCSITGPAVSSPDERLLFSRGKMLTLTREKDGHAITACIPDLARVRRFEISMDEPGQVTLAERGRQAQNVHEVLNDLVGWLKGDQIVA